MLQIYAVQAWYDENKDYDYDTDTCQPNAVCGHYTWVWILHIGMNIIQQ